MSFFYNMPLNSTILVVENAQFSVSNFSYFNVTVLNPSNSASDVNISALRLAVEATNQTYDVNTVEYPESLPFLLARGSRQTFKCIYDWSGIAGKAVRIEFLPTNVSTISNIYTPPSASLTLTPLFDAAQSVNYFNLTIANALDSTNLTVSDITTFGESIKDFLTPTLPYRLPNNQTAMFTCHLNWENLFTENVTMSISTAEGYKTSITTKQLPGAVLTLSNAVFNYSDTSYFDVTVRSTEESTTPATLNALNLTLANESISLYNDTIPPLNKGQGLPIASNSSYTLKCLWNWSQIRNQRITIQAYTRQNFTIPALNVTTPPSTVWNMTDVKFDFDDLTQFWVNVTNTACSTDNVTVARIQLNNLNTTLNQPPKAIGPSTQTMLSCALNWTDAIGHFANITVFATDGSNVSESLLIPTAQLKILSDFPVYGDFQGARVNVTVPYLNVTIKNAVNSEYNLTVSSIVLEAGNTTQDIARSILYPNATSQGYVISPGEEITFVCYLENSPYFKSSKTIQITVYTEEAVQASRTWQQQT